MHTARFPSSRGSLPTVPTVGADPCMQIPLAVDSTLPFCRQTPWIQTSLDAGQVACDVYWQPTPDPPQFPQPMNRQKGVKTSFEGGKKILQLSESYNLISELTHTIVVVWNSKRCCHECSQKAHSQKRVHGEGFLFSAVLNVDRLVAIIKPFYLKLSP